MLIDLDYANVNSVLAEILVILLLALDIVNQEAWSFGLVVTWDKAKQKNLTTADLLPSIRTPRSDTVLENWTLADSGDNSVVESLSSCCRVPSHTSCILSAFILSQLLDIHASTHSTNIGVVFEVDVAGALMTLVHVLQKVSVKYWGFLSNSNSQSHTCACKQFGHVPAVVIIYLFIYYGNLTRSKKKVENKNM